MRFSLRFVALLVAASFLAACDQPDPTPTYDDSVAEVIWTLPLSTHSDDARAHFKAGLNAFDMFRFDEANVHFEKAVAADSSFALAYLYTANSGSSTEEFTTNLSKAVALSGSASPAEQMLIMIVHNGFVNNVEGQLSLGLQLVELYPKSPRGWLALGAVQTNLNNADASRESLTRAISLEPKMATAYMQLGNNFLFLEPRGLYQAEEHFRSAIELAPNEPNPYDLLGDAYRAHGNLQEAYDAYTAAAERAPRQGLPLQQRAHVNSFLGNFDEARSDYTRSMELEMDRGNNSAAFFEVYRAYVNLHAGDPKAAVAELQDIVARAQDMELEGTDDIQINALTSLAAVAMHENDFTTASNALEQRAMLMRAQSGVSGVEEFIRGQEAAITYSAGILEARRGNASLAKAKADEFAMLVQPDPNPRKMERMHQILGISDYFQGNYSAAAQHLSQGDPGNVYMKYYRALALENSDKADEARTLLAEIAHWNFNDVGFALVRNDVLERVGNL